MNETEVFPAPLLDAAASEEGKWRSEQRVFLRLLSELLLTHRDQHVAIHEGKLVDADRDKLKLASRVYQRFGYVPIYIGLVSETRPLARIPSRRPVSEIG